MGDIVFSKLVNINLLKEMTESLCAITGISVSIIDAHGKIIIEAGWQDICKKFHRVHPCTSKRCLLSSKYTAEHLIENRYIEYKCMNNMRDVGVPIIIGENYIGTILVGQFFYDNEIVDLEIFRKQALEFGFDEKEYLDALNRVHRFSREKIHHIMKYWLGHVITLSESGLRQLEYEKSRAEIAKSQKYLKTIFNSVSDAIIIHDFDGEIIDVNEKAVLMFGYSKDELINMNVNDILSPNWRSSESTRVKIVQQLKNKNSITNEYLCRTKKNCEFWIEVNDTTTTLSNKGEVVISAVRDVTDRKLNKLILRKQAYEIENLRTEFFSNISHELKTPLSIILGAIEIIEMGIKNEEKPLNSEKILNNIAIEKQNCFRLLRLINNLIDSTRLGLGYFEVDMIKCDIVSLVEKITLSVVEHADNNKISLIFDTDIEEKIINCDPDKIERIILNLLSNAIRFTPEGGNIFVKVHNGDEYITIMVKDNGIGIPRQKLQLIFDRFKQVDKSFGKNRSGNGVGLALTKLLVEMHGGNISVESTYGTGTKFFIKLPVEMPDDKNKRVTKLNVNRAKDDCAERIKIEFSDIYK